ncbi:MAG: hypothetical protein NC253_05400 [Ruminococcus sp.]|nr:hypothetical protein [Ruminococcus sp.]MCM1381807.1 hypothetical protein [Muribaculaceae bacterium]MCM1478265.1 hypothetical protein [Muribaculaceae bacterium]
MSMTSSEMTPADIFAVTCGGRNNNGGGFLGDGIVGLIALIIIGGMFGFGGFGMGGGMGGIMPWLLMSGGFNGFGGNGGGALTRGELCQDMNFSDLESAVGRLSDNQALQFTQLNNGLCNLGYQNAQLINGIGAQISSEFRSTDNALSNLGFNMQQGQNVIVGAVKDNTVQGIMNTNAVQQQIAQCCCDSEKTAMQNRFAAQQDTCATLQAIDKLGDRIEARLNAQESAVKDARIQEQDRIINSLNLMQSQANQTNEIRTSIMNELRNCPVGTYNVPNPNCCYGPWGGMNWTGFVNNNSNSCNSCGL